MANTGLQKTKKIGPYKYERTGPSLNRRFSFGVDKCFMLVNHKGNPTVVLTDDHRTFYSRHVLGPQKARLLIGWLARYIAMVDPDPISVAIASTKAHAEAIKRDQNIVAKELGL